eukprot:1141079-Pelagomonas_calceolata.AAC.2
MSPGPEAWPVFVSAYCSCSQLHRAGAPAEGACLSDVPFRPSCKRRFSEGLAWRHSCPLRACVASYPPSINAHVWWAIYTLMGHRYVLGHMLAHPCGGGDSRLFGANVHWLELYLQQPDSGAGASSNFQIPTSPFCSVALWWRGYSRIFIASVSPLS